VAPALLTCREEKRAHTGSLPDADGADRTAYVLHGVVDCEPRCHDAARRVDVELNVFVRIFTLEEQELGDDDVRNRVIHSAPQKDDAILKQTAEDIPGALTAVRCFNNVGNAASDALRLDLERVSVVL